MYVAKRLILRLIDGVNRPIVVESPYISSGIVHTSSERITRSDIVCCYSILLVSGVNRRSVIKKYDRMSAGRKSEQKSENRE